MKARKKLLLVGIETTIGTPVAIADCVLMTVSELDSAPYEGDRSERQRIKEQFGADAEVNMAPYTTVTTTIPLAGSGTVGTPPNFGVVLRALGIREMIDTGVDVRYMPATDDHESLTVYFVEDGQLQCVPGCKGTAEIGFTAKGFPTAQVTLTGSYQRPITHTDAVTQTETNHAGEIPVNKQNTSKFDVHGYEGCGQSLSFSLGNEVVYRNLAGCDGVEITDRSVSGTVEIEAPDITTKNYFQQMESHQVVNLDAISFVHGTTPGNIIEFRAPKAQLSTISRADSDGVLHYQLGARFLPNAGDDEFVLIFK